MVKTVACVLLSHYLDNSAKEKDTRMVDPLPVKTMRRLLESRKPRDLDWAHNLCTTGRFVHRDVWMRPLDRTYVNKTVVPLYTETVSALRTFAKSKDLSPQEKKLVQQFIHNNTCRQRNIKENFLKGKRSNLVPDDKVSGPKKRHA